MLFMMGLMATGFTSCRETNNAGDEIEEAADEVGDEVEQAADEVDEEI
jgi:hypothetical protein